MIGVSGIGVVYLFEECFIGRFLVIEIIGFLWDGRVVGLRRVEGRVGDIVCSFGFMSGLRGCWVRGEVKVGGRRRG